MNDIHLELTNFWRVLQHPGKFRDFYRQIEVTPFSEIDWDKAWEPLSVVYEEIQAAVSFFIRARQSRQGLMRDFATLSRNRTRRGMNEQVSSWLTAIEGLPEVHVRLKRVAILNDDAFTVIRRQDGPSTLFYCDPPYLPSTHSVPRAYLHEMTRPQHGELLRLLCECKGMVMISGYPNRLYDDVALADWNRHDFSIDNKASGAKVKRKMTECVWCKF